MTTARFGKTDNYSIFEMNEMNRDIEPRPKLAADMAANGFKPSCAIHCQELSGGRLKIVGGHHRFNEAKRLGLEIYYIVDNDNTDVAENELCQSKNWTAMDWIKCYKNRGVEDYEFLYRFIDKYKINTMNSVSLVYGECASSNNAIKFVSGGKFRVGNMIHANEVVSITEAARDLKLPFATKNPFVTAVSRALKFTDISYEKLRDKLKRYCGDIKQRSKSDDFLEEIEYIYNKASRDTIPIKHLAIQNGKKAQRSFYKTSK